MDELQRATDLDGKPLGDADVDASVELHAMARQIVQVLRSVDADVDVAPRLDHPIARVEDMLGKQLLRFVVDRRVLIRDV